MSLWFHLIWNSLASLDLSFLTLSSRSFQPIFLQIIFLALSLSLFFFCSPSNINVIPFAVFSNVQGKVSLFCRFFFSFCCSAWVSPIVLSSNLLIYFSNSSTVLFKPSNVFFSAVAVLFGTSLLNFSLCLSVFLLSHFMVINFNYLLCRLLISTSFCSFSEILAYSLSCNIFLYIFILPKSLYLFLHIVHIR